MEERPGGERTLWQSLAQLAVGITHVQRGNVKGAGALLDRAAAGLSAAGRPAPHGIDADGLVAYCAELIADLRAGAPVGPDRLMPRLTAVDRRAS